MTTKREWVLEAIDGKASGRVPVGFWHHFTSEDEWGLALKKPDIIQKNLKGHQQFLETTKPDFIKLMSDGFFDYPNDAITPGIQSIRELSEIDTIGENHLWIEQQIELVKNIRASFPEDIASFYNIFAPVTYLKWKLAEKVASGDRIIADFIKEDALATKKVLDVIAADIALLVRRLIRETGIDGIYLSVQNLQVDDVSKEDYLQFIKPSEISVLEAALAEGGKNILHICGYEGASNDLTYYTDYPAHVFNWAVGPEGISLAQGRQLFGSKTVLGGFENTKQGLLYTGTKEDIQAEVQRLVAEANQAGLIIGADCTIPSDTAIERIAWVKEALVH